MTATAHRVKDGNRGTARLSHGVHRSSISATPTLPVLSRKGRQALKVRPAGFGETDRLSVARDSSRSPSPGRVLAGAVRCRRKFLRVFPHGFRDETYLAWERDYKWQAHEQWNEMLNRDAYCSLLQRGKFADIAAHAVRVESRTNLLFSFEKMALRDAVKSPTGARRFAEGLYNFLYSPGTAAAKFSDWCATVALLPRKQTRVLTWPLVTVFGFIAQPDVHMFLKPNVTRMAARNYGFDFRYTSQPAWETYRNLLDFVSLVRRDLGDLHPRDMIDIQSFLWVQGSEEYAD